MGADFLWTCGTRLIAKGPSPLICLMRVRVLPCIPAPAEIRETLFAPSVRPRPCAGEPGNVPVDVLRGWLGDHADTAHGDTASSLLPSGMPLEFSSWGDNWCCPSLFPRPLLLTAAVVRGSALAGTLVAGECFDSYWRFAAERMRIFHQRAAGMPWPWTDDPVLSRHKFTNVYRADERPYEHGYTSDADRVAADDAHVAELNLVAGTAGAPRIQPCPLAESAPDPERGRRPGELPQPGLQQQLARDILPDLPPGAACLSRAIRAWHAVPYDDRATSRVRDRFVGLIGYRLLELAGSGREEDAAAVLRTLAGPASYPEGARFLRSLAEGLERHGQTALAAQAYALTWTRTRGGGGWLSFGGKTALDVLRDATRLDPAIAARLVAEETEQAVASSRYGTNGITQGVIIAFAGNALTVPGADSADVAFAMWEEARASSPAARPGWTTPTTPTSPMPRRTRTTAAAFRATSTPPSQPLCLRASHNPAVKANGARSSQQLP